MNSGGMWGPAGARSMRLAAAMSENDLLDSVLDLARIFGLRTAHFRTAWTEKGWRTPVAGDGQGWPDLIIVGTRLIVRELKKQTGRIEGEQAAWLYTLRVADVDAGVWRPEQWHDGTIRAELEAIRHPKPTERTPA